MEEVKLTLKRKTKEVEIDDRKYILQEMCGSERDEYVNYVTARQIVEKGELTGMRDVKGIQSLILSKTLIEDTGKLVERKIIESFPTTTINNLYKMAQILSGIGLDKDELKNE